MYKDNKQTSYKNWEFCSQCWEIALLMEVIRNWETQLMCWDCISNLKAGWLDLNY